MKLKDNNGYKKVKTIVLAGVVIATIVLSVIALVLRKLLYERDGQSKPAHDHDRQKENDDSFISRLGNFVLV